MNMGDDALCFFTKLPTAKIGWSRCRSCGLHVGAAVQNPFVLLKEPELRSRMTNQIMWFKSYQLMAYFLGPVAWL